jgi:hypothetical protein
MYQEHYNAYLKYVICKTKYVEAIDRKELFFDKTQPKAVNPDSVRVSGGTQTNGFENYIIATENIDEQINELKAILDERYNVLMRAEQELRNSRDWNDRIYVYKYLDKLTIKQIERKVPYSRRQLYRILDRIRDNLTIL